MDRERIDRLVTLAARREDEVGREVASLQAQVRSATERFAELENCHNQVRALTRTGSEQSGETLAQAEAYAGKLRSRMDQAAAALALAQDQLREARAALTEASRERLAAEKLAWREQQQAHARSNADAQREDDEQSLRRRLTKGN